LERGGDSGDHHVPHHRNAPVVAALRSKPTKPVINAAKRLQEEYLLLPGRVCRRDLRVKSPCTRFSFAVRPAIDGMKVNLNRSRPGSLPLRRLVAGKAAPESPTVLAMPGCLSTDDPPSLSARTRSGTSWRGPAPTGERRIEDGLAPGAVVLLKERHGRPRSTATRPTFSHQLVGKDQAGLHWRVSALCRRPASSV
jgi:hypothetical protein